jgi:hypothetical protein
MVSRVTTERAYGAEAIISGIGNDRVAGALSQSLNTCSEPDCGAGFYLSPDIAGPTVTGGSGSGMDHGCHRETNCSDVSPVQLHRDEVLTVSLADHANFSFVRLWHPGGRAAASAPCRADRRIW